MANKKRQGLLILLIFFIAAVIALAGLFKTSLLQSGRLPQIASPTTSDASQPNIDAVILDIPVIEYPGGNQLADPIITAYQPKTIRENDEFILDAATLGNRLGQSVGALKLRLVQIQPASVTVSVLADSGLDGNFHPRDPIESLKIEDGSCIGAYPLVMDVSYRYCFELGKSDSKVTLKYSLREESTMPSP